MYISNRIILEALDAQNKSLLKSNPNRFVLDSNSINCFLKDIHHNFKFSNRKYRKHSYIIDKTNLYIILFSQFPIACSDLQIFDSKFVTDSDKVNFLMESLFCNYSNNILSILNLVINGFDYQASILIRNTIELSFLIVTLLIDPSKISIYCELANHYDYQVWRKNFSFKSLNDFLENYENKITKHHTKLTNSMKSWRKNIYSFYSEHTHNAVLPSIIFCRSSPINDKMYMNLFGTYSTRIDKILEELDFVLYYTMLMIFYNLQYKYKYKPDYQNVSWIVLSELYVLLNHLTLSHLSNQDNLS